MGKRADINLIPTELQQQKKIEEVKKSFNYLGLGLFLVLGLLSVSFFTYRIKLKSDGDSLDRQIKREQEKIADLTNIEQDARRLKVKSEVIGKVFKNQNRYSFLLDTLSESTPREVTITNFSTSGESKINLSGTAFSYVSLANFILTALDPSFGGKIFNGADLTSVSLDDISGKAKFTLVFYIKSNVLSKEKL